MTQTTIIISIICIIYLISAVVLVLLAQVIEEKTLMKDALIPFLNTIIILFFLVGIPTVMINDYYKEKIKEKNKNKPFYKLLYTRQ